MGWFRKATEFLQKPAVRIGLAVGSGLGGMGAFDSFSTKDDDGTGTDWGNVLNTGFGIGNVASAAASRDAWAIPQAGLGAYGILQNNQIGGVGNFGTFQDSYNRVQKAPPGFGAGMGAFFKGGTQPASTAIAAPLTTLNQGGGRYYPAITDGALTGPEMHNNFAADYDADELDEYGNGTFSPPKKYPTTTKKPAISAASVYSPPNPHHPAQRGGFKPVINTTPAPAGSRTFTPYQVSNFNLDEGDMEPEFINEFRNGRAVRTGVRVYSIDDEEWVTLTPQQYEAALAYQNDGGTLPLPSNRAPVPVNTAPAAQAPAAPAPAPQGSGRVMAVNRGPDGVTQGFGGATNIGRPPSITAALQNSTLPSKPDFASMNVPDPVLDRVILDEDMEGFSPQYQNAGSLAGGGVERKGVRVYDPEAETWVNLQPAEFERAVALQNSGPQMNIPTTGMPTPMMTNADLAARVASNPPVNMAPNPGPGSTGFSSNSGGGKPDFDAIPTSVPTSVDFSGHGVDTLEGGSGFDVMGSGQAHYHRNLAAKAASVPSEKLGAQVRQVTAAKTENNSDKADGFSFEKMFDKILDKVADDPMQAISVGSALISAFTDTKQEDQAAAYASEMAHYRSRMDPSSSFAQEWQGAFIQDQEDSIDKHYQKARADLTASMTKRYGGVQNSTVATAALQSLDKARADLKRNLKNDAYIAYSNYARQMVAGEAQGSKIAGLGAAAAGMSGPDFQKSLAAATKAVSA